MSEIFCCACWFVEKKKKKKTQKTTTLTKLDKIKKCPSECGSLK